MDITKADIFAKELKWDCGPDKLFKEKGQAIIAECKRFEELYIAKRRRFDKQCSSMEVASLIKKTAEQEFKFELDAVCKEASRWQTIYNKYNDITRLYNSRNCRPGQEDMKIIDGYREELYDMVGHPIYLEKVNEEHNEAYRTWEQKKKEKEEIGRNIEKRYYELRKKVDDNVLSRISDYSRKIKAAFSNIDETADVHANREPLVDDSQVTVVKQNDTTSTLSPGKKKGRPSKKGDYEKEAISDFKTCFKDKEYAYAVKIINAIKEQEAKSINGPIANFIATKLFNVGKLKDCIKSKKVLVDFMISVDKQKFSITSGISAYKEASNTSSDDEKEEKIKYWGKLLYVEKT